MSFLRKTFFEQSQTSLALLVIQVAALLTVIFEIPIARQVIGFIYLTFVPGFALFRLLKLDLSIIEVVLFSVGLSLAFLMSIGLLTNSIGYLIGFHKPLSLDPLLFVISIVFVLLLIGGWRRQVTFESSTNLSKLLVAGLVLSVLPIASIIGSIAARTYGDNAILLALIIGICLTIGFAVFAARKLPTELYALIICAVALALMFQLTFSSNSIIGFDIWNEYTVFKLTLDTSYWNPVVPSNLHAMLSVTILPTFYSNILNIDATWVMKIIYPLLFVFVPLGVYQLFKSKLSKEIVFSAVFFFMAYSVFFNELVMLPRQMIGEIFYVLLFLTLFSQQIKGKIKWFLFAFFSFGLVVSHYSMAYLFLGFAVATYLFSVAKKRNTAMKLDYIVTFGVITFAWYIYTASSVTLDILINIVNILRTNFFTGLFEASTRGSEVLVATGVQATSTFWHVIGRGFFYVTVALIIIGFLATFLKKKNKPFDNDFTFLMLLNLLLITASIVVPYFATTFNLSRFYQVALFFLAPLCLLGGITILAPLKRIINTKYFASVVLIVVLIPYFLFQTGFVYETSHEESWSLPLSGYRQSSTWLASRGVIGEAEVKSASWLSIHRDIQRDVYADAFNAPLIYKGIYNLYGATLNLPQNSSWYYYLRDRNINDGNITATWDLQYTINTTDAISFLNGTNLVYSSGSNIIFATP